MSPFALRSGLRNSILTNVILAWAGGYLDGFTFFGHGRVFANAMTANVVLLGADVLANPTHPGLHHLLPLLMFVVGVWAARALRHEWITARIRHPDVVILLTEILVFLVLASFPQGTPSLALTIPIVFVAALQLRTFATVHSHSYASTITTGNLISLSEALFDFWFVKRDESAALRCRIFSCICGAFLAGAISGSVAVRHLANRALLIEIVALLGVVPMVRSESRGC